MQWRTYIAALVALALVILAAFWLSDEPDEADDASSESEIERQTARPQQNERAGRSTRPTARTSASAESARRSDTGPEMGELAAPDPVAERRSGPTPDPVPTLPAEFDLPSVDMGSADADEWKDPVNRRVLGEKHWMAPVADEENDAIDDVFEKARAAQHDPGLSNRDRRTSIEVAREVVDACFDDLDERQPGIEGRIIVAWEAGAEQGEGWIRSPRIKVNYKLEDARFESCVLDGLRDLTYPAADGEEITVEYPFFYDGK